MGIGGNLFHFQIQMTAHTQYLLINLPFHFLLLLHDGLETSLGLRPHVELVVLAACHVNALLDHLADLANGLNIPPQLLLDVHNDWIADSLVL